MKNTLRLAGVLVVVVFLASCSSNQEVSKTDFTGNQTTYALEAASQYPISGTVIFKERKDGTTTAEIALKGVSDSDTHPVHLHMGDLSTDKALIAALLTPVSGADGTSASIISQLADGSKVTYADLVKLSACIKIHLGSTGDEANVILAAGNIGSAVANASPGSKAGIAVCASK